MHVFKLSAGLRVFESSFAHWYDYKVNAGAMVINEISKMLPGQSTAQVQQRITIVINFSRNFFLTFLQNLLDANQYYAHWEI